MESNEEESTEEMVMNPIEKMIKRLNKIANNLEKERKDIIAVIPAEVKKWGYSAHIPSQKKFIGHPVDVIIKKMDNRITIYPGKELKEKIKEEAEKQHRSMSDLVIFVLKEYFINKEKVV